MFVRNNNNNLKKMNVILFLIKKWNKGLINNNLIFMSFN